MNKEIVSVILLFGSTLELNRLRVPNFRQPSKMVKQCCIPGYNPKYHSRTKTGIKQTKKVRVMRFTVNKEKCTSKNIQPSREAVLCDHWPSSYPEDGITSHQEEESRVTERRNHELRRGGITSYEEEES